MITEHVQQCIVNHTKTLPPRPPRGSGGVSADLCRSTIRTCVPLLRQECHQSFTRVCCNFAGARAQEQNLPFSRYPRSLLQSVPAPAVEPATTNVALLPATEAIAMLCSRNITSVAYVQALFDYYDSGGFACLNSFITMNRPQVNLGCLKTFLVLSSENCPY